MQPVQVPREILTLIYDAIDEVNATSADGAKLDKTQDTHLLGSSSGLDSLTFVNFIVAVEGRIEQALGKSVLLIDEDNLALQEHPFRTVGTLASYVEKVMGRYQSA